MPLGVGWRKVPLVGGDPDLQEADRFRLGGVELAVEDAGAGAHQLDLSGGEGFGVAEAVLMSERAFEDVAEDFHIPMRMGREPHARGDDIVVDDTQAAKAHVGGIEVIGETEGVEGSEPAVVGVSAFLCVPNENFIGWDDAFHG